MRLLALFVGMALAATVTSGQQSRIRRPSNGASAMLQGNVHPLAQLRSDRGVVDPEMSLPYLTLHFRPSTTQQAGLDRLLTDQQDVSSPNFHRWLTPEEFGDHFGLSDDDITMIATWLRSQGFQVHGAARGRRWITFGGKAAQIGRAFQTSIHRYEINGKSRYANT